MDSAGNLYVADNGNQSIRKLALDSTGTNWVVSTVAGRGYHNGLKDGIGTNALFSSPGAVAVDSVGKVYVSEVENDDIRLGVPYPVPVQVVQANLSADQAVLCWPASAAGFVLETSAPTSGGPWIPLTTASSPSAPIAS